MSVQKSNHRDLLRQVLELREALYRQQQWGPFKLTVGADIIIKLDEPFWSHYKPERWTVEGRLTSIDGIAELVRDPSFQGIKLEPIHAEGSTAL